MLLNCLGAAVLNCDKLVYLNICLGLEEEAVHWKSLTEVQSLKITELAFQASNNLSVLLNKEPEKTTQLSTKIEEHSQKITELITQSENQRLQLEEWKSQTAKQQQQITDFTGIVEQHAEEFRAKDFERQQEIENIAVNTVEQIQKLRDQMQKVLPLKKQTSKHDEEIKELATKSEKELQAIEKNEHEIAELHEQSTNHTRMIQENKEQIVELTEQTQEHERLLKDAADTRVQSDQNTRQLLQNEQEITGKYMQ